MPPEGTIERWAFDYVTSTSLAHKLAPPPLPRTSDEHAWELEPPSRRALRPGRPVELVLSREKVKALSVAQLASPKRRARLLHVFFHHELQAAELFAWAALSFVDAPRALRAGWLKLALEEVRHMGLYAREIERLGARIGEFPVRDWFWERVPACETPASFLALVGVGLEGGNLDHGERFRAMFEAAGDHASALAIRRVAEEEIAHVRFAVRWLERLEVPVRTLDALFALLPPPLSPMLLRGRPFARAPRLEAGLDPVLLDALEAYVPSARGPGASPSSSS